MARLYPFAVNGLASDEKAAKVVKGLHHLVELGARAKAALRQLETNECCDDEVPYVENYHDAASDGGRGKYARLEFVRLPKLIPWGRADLPHLADCRVEFGDASTVTVKGQEFRQAPFVVHIRGIVQTDQSGGYEAADVECRIGMVRFNKRNLRYVDPNDEAYPLTRAPHASKDGMAGLKRMASLLSERFVQLPAKTHASKATHKTIDLRRAAEGWLIEEKIVHKIACDALDLAAVKEVLES